MAGPVEAWKSVGVDRGGLGELEAIKFESESDSESKTRRDRICPGKFSTDGVWCGDV